MPRLPFRAARRVRRLSPALTSVALLALATLMAAPAAAQAHRTGLTLTGGWSRPGNLTPGFESETVLEPGWTVGLQLETWLPAGRFGFRTSGSFASRSDQNGDRYGVVSGDVGALARLLPARPGRAAAPYAVLGMGLAHFRSEGGSTPIGGGLYGSGPLTRGVAVAGLGVDLLNRSRIGLRVEASDQVVLLSLGESPESQGLPTAHNLHVTTGIQLRLGRLRPPRRGVPAGPATTLGVIGRENPAEKATTTPAPESAGGAVASGEPEPAAERAPAPVAVPSREPVSSPAPVGSLEPTPLGQPVPDRRPAPEERQEVVTRSARSAPAAAAPAAEALFTVQVGSLVEAATARRWGQRLQERKIPFWLGTVTVQGQEFLRLRVGVAGSEAEAAELARALVRIYRWPVSVDRITGDDRPPQGSRSATLAFLRNGG